MVLDTLNAMDHTNPSTIERRNSIIKKLEDQFYKAQNEEEQALSIFLQVYKLQRESLSK